MRPATTTSRPHEESGPGEDAWLVAERGGGLSSGERFDLFGGLSIGRSADADVRIEDRYASGLHARIYRRAGRYYVEDMNSTNGTLLNDASLSGEAELVSGRPGPDRRHRVPLRAGVSHAEGRRSRLSHRHGSPTARERGFLLRPRAGLSGRRRDGRRPGRRGGLEDGRRGLRARPSRWSSRDDPAGDDRVRQPQDPRARRGRSFPRREWGRRSPRRCSTPTPRRWRSATSATAVPTACAKAASSC